MGDFAYGGMFNLWNTGKDELGFIARMNSGVAQQETAGIIEWLHPWATWLPMIKAASLRMFAAGKRAIDMRKQKGTASKDLFYYFVSCTEFSTAPTANEVSSTRATRENTSP